MNQQQLIEIDQLITASSGLSRMLLQRTINEESDVASLIVALDTLLTKAVEHFDNAL